MWLNANVQSMYPLTTINRKYPLCPIISSVVQSCQAYRYSLGSTPNCFLKQREKYFGVLKPTRAARSTIVIVGSARRILVASSSRMLLTNSTTVLPVIACTLLYNVDELTSISLAKVSRSKAVSSRCSMTICVARIMKALSGSLAEVAFSSVCRSLASCRALSQTFCRLAMSMSARNVSSSKENGFVM